jgi:hypothetical protein
MTPPQRPSADRLWRRLADAQDAALREDALPAPQAAKKQARPRSVGRSAFAAIVVVALGIAVAIPVLRQRPARLAVHPGGALGDDRVLVADARSELPLQFSDGSSLTFRAGSAGRLHRLDSGAEVFLESGRLESHVVHTPTTLWLVHAGSYRVRVTGTRFAVGWSAGRLEVELFEGSVIIDGAELGAGVPLEAQHRLIVDHGIVRTDRLAPSESPSTASPGLVDPAAAPPPVSVAGSSDTGDATRVRGRADDRADWLTLASQGSYTEAFRTAKSLGWTRLCRRLEVRPLLMLGDVARYNAARPQAQEAFEALVMRFPRDPLAADAVFSLGRLAFEAGQSDEAARWFRHYVEIWPDGALADQAVGRLLEGAVARRDREAARGAARAYLARTPNGPQAGLARQTLESDRPSADVTP